MFHNSMPRYEILSSDALATLDSGWRKIVTEIGVQFAKPEAVELFAANGQKVGDHAEARDLIRMAGLEVRLELIRYHVGPPLLEVLNRVGLPEEKAAALRALLA